MDRRTFASSLLGLQTGQLLHSLYASDSQPGVEHDFRRVIVAVFYMPVRRGRPGFCPGCEVLKKDIPHIMQALPDVFFGFSEDGKTPPVISTDNGESRRYRQSPSRLSKYPTVVIYTGQPGTWGEPIYQITGYEIGDKAKLEQMIKWAAEI